LYEPLIYNPFLPRPSGSETGARAHVTKAAAVGALGIVLPAMEYPQRSVAHLVHLVTRSADTKNDHLLPRSRNRFALEAVQEIQSPTKGGERCRL